MNAPKTKSRAVKSAAKTPAKNAAPSTQATDATSQQNDDQQVLLCALMVKAKSPNGFWRCKRFWSREGSHALVVPDGDDMAAIRAENPEMESIFISEEEYERLADEPNLTVEVLPPDALEIAPAE